MRQILFSGLLISALALAGDGKTPRASSSDYPAHQDTATASIAAVRVPPDQLNKNLPSDFSKRYVVVEIAIYPKNGSTVEIVPMDFVLKLADGESHPDTAEEVAALWRPHTNAPRPDPTGNVHVTTETGVIVQHGQDPVTGRRVNNVGTYEGVGVSNYPTQPSAPPSNSSRVDADRMEADLRKWALPEGKTTAPVAGYLYFPVSPKRSKGALELEYAHDGSSANLKLPAPSK